MNRSKRWSMSLFWLLSVVVVLGASAVAAQDPPRRGEHGGSVDEPGWRLASTRQLDADGELISLSPDGRWIAGEGPFGAFCVWDVADLQSVCATEEQYSAAPGSIVWAPDSSAVAFSMDFGTLGIESDIFVFDVERGKIRNLTDDGIENIGLDYLIEQTDLLAEHTGPLPIDVYPTWSLDGQKLTFARFDYLAEARTQTLMTVSVDGGEPSTLLELKPASHPLIDSPMRWLPNGSLLFTTLPEDVFEPEAGGMWIYEPGGEPIQVLSGTAGDPYPVPIATDVFEHDGTTTILGMALFAGIGGPSSDPDLSGGFALDLESGTTVPLETFASIDSASADDGEDLTISASARTSPHRSDIVLGVEMGFEGPDGLVVAPIDSGSAPLFIEIEASSGVEEAFRGYSWASNDTILVPVSGGPAVLLTLERSAEATPAAPCSCTPPPQA